MSLTVPDERLNEAAERIAALVAAVAPGAAGAAGADPAARAGGCRRAPTRATPGSTSSPPRPVELPAGRPRGRRRPAIAVAIPPGHAGLVLPRSGLARRHGVTLANAPA